MIEVDIPKDISKVEQKFMGLVTAKQAVGLVVAIGLTLAMRKALGDNENLKDVKNMLTLVTAGGPLALATYKPYGMSLFQFIVQYMYTNFFSPKKRIYKIENKYLKQLEDEKKHEDFIVFQYDRIHKIKHRNAKIDVKEDPKVKKNKNESLTGYI